VLSLYADNMSMLQFTPPVVKELLGWKRGEMSAQVWYDILVL